MENSLNVFIAYSREDSSFLDELRKHFKVLERRVKNPIKVWYDGLIEAGNDWGNEIKNELHNADFILLLISSDFISSDYCYDVEMKTALELHERGETRVIPIILRDCLWEDTHFSHLQVLPKDGIPIASPHWENIDIPLKYIVKKIDQLSEGYFIESKYNAAVHLFEKEKWSEALELLESIKIKKGSSISIDSEAINSMKTKCKSELRILDMLDQGIDFFESGQFSKAIEVFKKVEQIQPSATAKEWILKCESSIGKIKRIEEEEIFNAITEEGNDFFDDEKWQKAKEKFEKALSLFQSSFQPNQDFFRKKIKTCEKFIAFESKIRLGDLAVQSDDYLMAKYHYEKALLHVDDKNTQEKLKKVHEEIERIKQLQLIRFKDESKQKYGYKDVKSGKIIIPAKYAMGFDFIEDVTPVCLNEKWGLINKAGMIISDFQFDRIMSFINGKAMVLKNEEWKYIDRNGNLFDSQ